jgi:hypothetical protein
VSDNQVTVACATLEKLCQISLLPLRTEQQNTSSEINTINLLNLINEPKNACTIRDSYGIRDPSYDGVSLGNTVIHLGRSES